MGPRIALVSGGTGAIGRVICTRLATDGYRVVANCHPRDHEAALAWQRDLAGGRMEIGLYPFDVSDYEVAAAEVERIGREVGAIDVLVNAAGITRDAPLVRMTPGDWSAVLRTNLDSLYNMTRSVLPGMIERRYGRVVNISSVNGQRGQFGQANYSTAKAGVHGFTMAVAREVARKGVTVNTVSPGYIQSPLIMAVPEDVRGRILEQFPVGRFGEPAEIARAVAFLAAEDAAYITGADLSVNGGYHMA
jgi:acetoacetyl-CoA reductase